MRSIRNRVGVVEADGAWARVVGLILAVGVGSVANLALPPLAAAQTSPSTEAAYSPPPSSLGDAGALSLASIGSAERRADAVDRAFVRNQRAWRYFGVALMFAGGVANAWLAGSYFYWQGRCVESVNDACIRRKPDDLRWERALAYANVAGAAVGIGVAVGILVDTIRWEKEQRRRRRRVVEPSFSVGARSAVVDVRLEF